MSIQLPADGASASLPELAPAVDWREADASEHSVQFYAEDVFLLDSLSRFIGGALGAGEPAIVIAAREHRQGLLDRLAGRGLDVQPAISSGRFVLLDAGDVLDGVLVNGWPDKARFMQVVGGAVGRLSEHLVGPSDRIAAFGEMVMLLWAGGMAQAAIRLEQLWNDLGQLYQFRLRCAYSMSAFSDSKDAAHLASICDQHSLVIPAEDYAALTLEADRLRRIALLQQKAQALETALKAREEFISIAAHELRTPIAAVKGSAQLLRRQRDHDPARLDGTLAILEQSANRLARLVDDLLDSSRMRNGHLTLACRSVDLRTIVETAAAREQELAGRLFELRAPEGPCAAWADAERLDQVMSNLLGNAVKYSPPGSTIRIDIGPRDAGWLIAVSDRGIGLPEGAAEHIFQPFARAANAAFRTSAGMGLGLYICREIIDMHGGHVWAESPGEGQGTTVYVSLPAGSRSPEAAA